jgi:hypothetical protein
MDCNRCHTEIEPDDERKHLGQVLCEDCLMVVLSPMKTCDPWAVHSAKSFENNSTRKLSLTPIQTEILAILKKSGPIQRENLLAKLENQIDRDQLEREFATLRHLEKVRAEKRGQQIFVRLW